jgi:hypothetical protein
MSRSGYDDCYESERLNLYRANVDRAIRGKRGQAFLREMLAALDAIPDKRLASHVMEEEADGTVCAIGSVGRARNLDMRDLKPDSYDEHEFALIVAKKFKISVPLAREIMFENDDHPYYAMASSESPEDRFSRMRRWVASHIISEESR